MCETAGFEVSDTGFNADPGAFEEAVQEVGLPGEARSCPEVGRWTKYSQSA